MESIKDILTKLKKLEEDAPLYQFRPEQLTRFNQLLSKVTGKVIK